MTMAAHLVTIITSLDRCAHGRHRGDTCAGYDPNRPRSGCPGGISLGNPWLRSGAPIGYDYTGRVIILPAEPATTSDPDAWIAPGGDLPPGYEHPDDDPARRPSTTAYLNRLAEAITFIRGDFAALVERATGVLNRLAEAITFIGNPRTGKTWAPSTLRCPTCDSPDPRMHPSTQADGGEVLRLCDDPWHGHTTRPAKVGDIIDPLIHSLDVLHAIPANVTAIHSGEGDDWTRTTNDNRHYDGQDWDWVTPGGWKTTEGLLEDAPLRVTRVKGE